MPTKNTSIDFDNLVKLYLDGESLDNLSRDCHVSIYRIKDAIIERGFKLRTKAERQAIIGQKSRARTEINDPDSFGDICARYIAGESENALAKDYGVARNVIRNRLLKHGVEIRSYSAANLLKASQMTPEERQSNAAAAHAAVKGMKHSWEQLCLRAQSKEGSQGNRSQAELLLEKWLIERGVHVIPQKAIGKYNVDLGAYPVAVEVFGGGWHFYKNHVERFNYLFDQGWNIVIVYVNGKLSVLQPGAADYIVSFLQETARNPTVTPQYRMIWGEGKLYAAGSANADELASIVPLRAPNLARPTNKRPGGKTIRMA